MIREVDPIEGRCDCPDFVKNSLGICKHILVVLEHLHARPRLLQQASRSRNGAIRSSGMGLCWDPIRPLTGLGDWLDRVVWKGEVEPAKSAVGRGCPGAQVVPLEQDRRRDLEKQLLGPAGTAARAGRRSAQDDARSECNEISS